MRVWGILTIGAFLAASVFLGLAYFSYTELESFYSVFEHYGMPIETARENSSVGETEWNFRVGIARFLSGAVASILIAFYFLYRTFRRNEQTID